MKNQIPAPNIVCLAGLLALYIRAKNLQPDLNSAGTSQSKINSILARSMTEDGIVKNYASVDFINRLRGAPTDDTIETADGINGDKLDEITLKVIELYGFKEMFNLAELNYPWVTFIEKIFPAPHYLNSLHEKKYYKFLSEDEKRVVDRFVQRRVGELVPKSENNRTYLMYEWDTASACLKPSIFQIDSITPSFFLTNFSGAETKFHPRKYWCHDLKNPSFESSGKHISLVMVSEGMRKGECCHLVLSMDNTGLEASEIKGFLTGLSDNSQQLISREVFLESVSYYEALAKIKDGEFEKNERVASYLKNKVLAIG